MELDGTMKRSKPALGKRPYKSAALKGVHETATDLHAAGVLSKRKLAKFDKLCLKPVLGN